jgi:REP element-mobilizing transposase RayT
MKGFREQGSSGSPDPHSKKMKYSEGYHFITIVTNKRVEVFKYKDAALIAINTILFYEKRGDFNLKGYVIMPDHIHMICEYPHHPSGSDRSPDLSGIIPPGSGRSPDLPDIKQTGSGGSAGPPEITQVGSGGSPDLPKITQPGSGRSPDLPSIIRDIKKYIAKQTIRTLMTLDEEMLLTIRLSRQKKRRHTYQLWQAGYYDFNILTESKLNEKLKYMYENPLRKGLCNNPFDYEFSDAKRYFGSGDPKLPL